MSHLLVFSCLLLVLPAVVMPAGAATDVGASVVPAKPFVETATDGTKAVNCDFEIVERGNEPLELERIEMSVFDTKVPSNTGASSIRMAGRRPSTH